MERSMSDGPQKQANENSIGNDADAILELLKTFSMGELIAIAKRSQIVAEQGYGSLTITFEKHHPRRIEILFSEELHRYSPADRRYDAAVAK
jgi:hypothetical protein